MLASMGSPGALLPAELATGGAGSGATSGGTTGSAHLRAAHADLAEKTYQVLRDLVVTRALAPGSKVSAETLSQRFGVSRTTVKDAINQLAAEGLLVVRPQVGTFVRGVSRQDVHEIWDARIMIETHAARAGIPRATPAQVDELRALVEAMAPLVEAHEYVESGYERFVSLDRRLHELVVETAGSDFLMGLFRQVSVYVYIVNYRSRRGLRRADQGLAEHRAILAAYERRDPDLAAATITRHVERSRDVVLRALAQHGELL
jgi:DNA-binding GntR family transcriptional regulator